MTKDELIKDDEFFEEENEEIETNPLVEKAETFLTKYYISELNKLINNYPKEKSLYIDFQKIEVFNPDFADQLLDSPDLVIDAFNVVIQQYKPSLLSQNIDFAPKIRFFNLPEDKRILIKNLSSEHIGKLIAIEGIVRQFTTVLPKIKSAHWVCKHCGFEINLPQEDFKIRKPNMCPECKHKDFELDEKESEFMDYQKIEIQEPLDELKGGEQSNTLNIIVTDDLVNRFTAGDRLIFTGILRLRKPDKKQTIYGKYLEGLSIETTKQEYEEVEITKEDEEKIKKLISGFLFGVILLM